jgi:putrescine transport system substrate-binding protein
MIRKTLLVSAAFGLTAISAAHAQDRVVNVYNWSDYIDESIIDDFTKETGIEVVYDVFDSNEILETKLLAGGTNYDVVVPTASPFLARQIQAGVYQKLDKSKLPNLENAWDVIEERVEPFDPGNEYSVNYMWGTVGIGYNVAKVQELLGIERVDSWDVVFDPENMKKLESCGVYMLDSPTDVIPTALNYLGIDPNSTESEDIQAAEDLLLAVRPYVRKFHSSEYINALANGDICVAVGWSGDVFQARDRAAEADAGVTVDYAVPNEGALIWFDQLAIPADAPHPDEAHAFINYLLKPEVAAKASNYVYFANGNLASQEFLNDDIINDPAIYPTGEALEKLFVTLPYEPRTQRLVNRSWTRIVTGQ